MGGLTWPKFYVPGTGQHSAGHGEGPSRLLLNEWMNKAKGIEWAKGWQQQADGAEGFPGTGLAVGAIPSVFIPLGDPRGQGHSMGAHKCLSYKLYLCLRSIFRIGSTVCFQ